MASPADPGWSDDGQTRTLVAEVPNGQVSLRYGWPGGPSGAVAYHWICKALGPRVDTAVWSVHPSR